MTKPRRAAELLGEPMRDLGQVVQVEGRDGFVRARPPGRPSFWTTWRWSVRAGPTRLGESRPARHRAGGDDRLDADGVQTPDAPPAARDDGPASSRLARASWSENLGHGAVQLPGILVGPDDVESVVL